jgi:hypothetical protein
MLAKARHAGPVPVSSPVSVGPGLRRDDIKSLQLTNSNNKLMIASSPIKNK